uniref:STAS domain-containing protein n=1 Tax=Macrostomum lignano TaxID=282301 RepID=A0A1I8G134_9PLAT
MADNTEDLTYHVHRPVLDYGTFATKYRETFRRKRSLLEVARDEAKQQCGGCTGRHWVSRLLNLVPLVNLLRLNQYSRTDLLSDVVAGFTTCVFHIPQGLAYGLLASLKPINGLYTSLFPVFIFGIFGRSRHLSIGTFSLMALLLSDMIEANYEAYIRRMPGNFSAPMNYTGAEYAKLQTAVVGTFAASVMILTVGILRLGFFMRYMSDAMLKGFTAAAAVQSLINQFKVIKSTNFVTLGISIGSIIILYLVKEFVNPRVKKKIRVPLPIELIMIVISLLVSKFAKFNEKLQVAIVGEVPRGLPSPLVPDFGFLPAMLPAAIPVGLVGGVVTMSLAKMYCLEFQYSYDFNEDFAILGVSSLVSSFFQCFFACGALARNSVVVSVGMKSQLASLISCSGMLLVLLAIGPFFETIPTCVLGSIIVVSLINVMSPLKELPRIFRVSRVDFAVFVVSGLAVLVLDVTLGLVIGFAVTLFSVVLRTQLPSAAVLGRVEDTDLYEDLQVCPSAKALPGQAILRFNAPLNFANAEAFGDFVIRLGRDGQTMGQPAKGAAPPEEPVHTVVLDCSPWCYVDMVGVHRQLTDRGQRLLLAGCQDTIRASFAKQGLTLEVNPGPSSACFVSLHDAALFAMATASQPQGAPLFSNFVVVEDDVEGLIVNDAGVSEDS